jgi:hypothetical protein
MRRCRQCKEYNIPKEVPKFQFVCGVECSILYARKVVARKQNKERKEKRAVRREEVSAFNRKNLPYQLDRTQRVFNTLIRLLDRGQRCPTCGELLIEGQYDAGHVRTVASCPQLRYSARACFGQCRKCNGSGTIRKRTKKTQEVVSDLYKAWILETKGQEWHDWLFGPHASKHWLCDELIELRKELRSEVRNLKSGMEPSKNWRELSEK